MSQIDTELTQEQLEIKFPVLRNLWKPLFLQIMTIDELNKSIELIKEEMKLHGNNEEWLLLFSYFTEYSVRLEFKLNGF